MGLLTRGPVRVWLLGLLIGWAGLVWPRASAYSAMCGPRKRVPPRTRMRNGRSACSTVGNNAADTAAPRADKTNSRLCMLVSVEQISV